MDRENELIDALNDHKGQILALQSLVVSLLRALPTHTQATAIAEWEIEIEVAKTVLLNSSTPEEVVKAYDYYVTQVNNLRASRGKP